MPKLHPSLLLAITAYYAHRDANAKAMAYNALQDIKLYIEGSCSSSRAVPPWDKQADLGVIGQLARRHKWGQ